MTWVNNSNIVNVDTDAYKTAEQKDRQILTQNSKSVGVNPISVNSPGLSTRATQLPTVRTNTTNPGLQTAASGVGDISTMLSGIGYGSRTVGPNDNRELMGATKKGSVAISGGAGALSGAAKGFTSGGIPGAIIGGITGLAGGLFAGKKRKDKAQKELDSMFEQREEEEAAMAKSMRGVAKGYNASRTGKFMSQANSLYGTGGAHIGIARRGGIINAPIEYVIYTNNVTTNRIDIPITAASIKKACKGAEVDLSKPVDNTVVCSKQSGACSLIHKSESPVHHPVFRRGGSIINQKKRNIIPHGVTHEQENSTGINGDKGIPIVKNGQKVFELEKSEWVLNSDTSKDVVNKVYKYLGNPTDDILIDLGKIVQRELLLGTYSYDDQYGHLNH